MTISERTLKKYEKEAKTDVKTFNRNVFSNVDYKRTARRILFLTKIIKELGGVK